MVETIRQRLGLWLHSSLVPGGNRVNGLLIFLILFSISLLPLHYVIVNERLLAELFTVEKILVTIFSAEYLLRFWTAESPKKFFFSAWSIIDLIALVPFYFGQLGFFANVEFLLMLRALRLFRLTQLTIVDAEVRRYFRDFYASQISLEEDEQVEQVFQKHILFFLVRSLLVLFLLLSLLVLWVWFSGTGGWIWWSILSFFVGVTFLVFWKIWTDFSYDIIVITSNRLIKQDQELFGYSLVDVGYESITKISPNNEGIWRSLLRFGDINVDVVGSEQKIPIEFIGNPHNKAQIISRKRQAYFQNQQGKTVRLGE